MGHEKEAKVMKNYVNKKSEKQKLRHSKGKLKEFGELVLCVVVFSDTE